ncbi:MAG: gluconate 2-dehydrogenase subunit 3 family protein [Gemmatimonadales bacterium]|nr:gluconate 2-dehydrogenase subunit 3 family protein [Gemmatimonadales bacterium]
MNRREVLRWLGGAALAPLTPLSARDRLALGRRVHQLTSQAGGALSPAQVAFVSALSDSILPRTDTPGALDVEVPAFIDRFLAGWYAPADRTNLLAGIDALEEECRRSHGRPFAQLDAAERGAFLGTVDGKEGPPRSPAWGYRRVHELVVFGYTTSKPVAELLRDMPVIPGRFDGCVPV